MKISSDYMFYCLVFPMSQFPDNPAANYYFGLSEHLNNKVRCYCLGYSPLEMEKKTLLSGTAPCNQARFIIISFTNVARSQTCNQLMNYT